MQNEPFRLFSNALIYCLIAPKSREICMYVKPQPHHRCCQTAFTRIVSNYRAENNSYRELWRSSIHAMHY